MTTTVREILTGSLTCMLCDRSAGTIRVLDGRTRVTLARPEHAADVTRKRCPSCGGNLRVADTRYERHLHFYLAPADLVPRRGRPPLKPKAVTR